MTAGGVNVNLVFATVVVVFTTSFVFGYNSTLLNQPYVYVRRFFNVTLTSRRNDGTSPSDMTITVLWSLTNAINIVGQFAGSFIGAACVDKYGRKKSIQIGMVTINMVYVVLF